MNLQDGNLQVYEKKLLHTSSFMYFAFNFSERITITITQLTFTCSKSIIETLNKGVQYVQS